MSEHSHAERLSRRIELSAEELSLLLGPDRFAPTPAHEATVQDVAADETSSVPSPVVTESVAVDAVAVPTGATRCVGDTDLVQALLSGAPNFEQLALRAIRERTGEELARIITGSAADAMVIPSRQDNLPNTGLEAHACGTPVIAFKVGGLPDIVDHFKTGYLATPFDTEDLARGVQWVLGDGNLRKALSRSACERALKLWSPQVISNLYYRLYETLLT